MSQEIGKLANKQWLHTTGYLVLISLLGLPLISPLIRAGSSPCTHDGHLHYHRIAALGHAWQGGLYFSRWMPDLVFGYGYPFLLYREAAPLYLTLWPHLLGLSLPAALNLFYAAAILSSGWFMYLWVKDIFGSLAGVVSAVAYMAAPYLLIDALVRGNQPESMALALFPFLLWSGRRFVVGGRPTYLATTLTGYVLLALSHNISLLLFTPFLFLYLLFTGWLAKLKLKEAAIRLALIFVLGLGMSAFYVGPALLEMDQITISQSVSARNNDFRFNFAGLAEMLAPARAADPSLINPPLLLRLGWAPFIMALIGLVTGVLSKKKSWRLQAIFMGLAAALLLFMSTSLSQLIWEVLPLIEFVQFPWRFIGRAALPLAFLAGVPFAVLPDLFRDHALVKRIMPWAAALAVIILILESFPTLYPHQCRSILHPSINDVHAYERQTGLVGVDPLGSYFPKTVLDRPVASPLESDYQAGAVPDRFDDSTLADGAEVLEVSYRPLSATIVVDSPDSFTARYLSFAFPGWAAEVDGQPVSITPGAPDGLITFPVPAGRHTIEVYWQMTTVRQLMSVISGAALLATIAICIVLFRRQNASSEEYSEITPDGNQASPLSALAALALAAVFLIAFKYIVVDRYDTPFRQVGEPAVSTASSVSTAGLRLAGFNQRSEVVKPGESFLVDLAWVVQETPSAELQSNLFLIGPDGHFWSEKETYRPRTFQEPSPTTFWLPSTWAWDSREVEVLTGTPQGEYEIVLTLFSREDLQPLTLFDETGTAVGPNVTISRIEVGESSKEQDISPQFEVDQSVAGLNLLGYNLDRQDAAPGDQLLLTLFWEKLGDSDEDADVVTLTLSDDSGNIAAEWRLPPVRDGFPVQNWPLGTPLRGQHFIRLNAGLDTGVYMLRLEDLPLGSLNITAPERIYDMPASDRSLYHDFGNQITLTGISFDPPAPEAGSELSTTLIWGGGSEINTSYHVFLHLIDREGKILDQSDGLPAEWTRPTTGWAPGEFIVDSHNLMIPENADINELALRIGLYDPETGDRLRTANEEFIIMPLVESGD